MSTKGNDVYNKTKKKYLKYVYSNLEYTSPLLNYNIITE